MKALIATMFTASALAAPLYGFAQQDSATVTRAQVRSDLVQVERAGYSPSVGEDHDYPSDIQSAERKVAAQPGGSGSDSVGGVTARSASGHQVAPSMSNQ